MTDLNITKATAFLPISDETLADYVSFYEQLGWPNRCVFGRACFTHTFASDACA